MLPWFAVRHSFHGRVVNDGLVDVSVQQEPVQVQRPRVRGPLSPWLSTRVEYSLTDQQAAGTASTAARIVR